MIRFVNAKINIGLQVVNRRADGYHDLQSVFYPVGIYAGTPENPESFCDILEITEVADTTRTGQFSYVRSGRPIDCPVEKDLTYKAARLFMEKCNAPNFEMRLYKNLPDGAGMGGGSADAGFVLTTLNEMNSHRMSDAELCAMAVRLGADCPFFIHNRPAYVEGIGDRIEPIALDLSGYWLVAVKPDLHISTAEAFAGITPHQAQYDLRAICNLPVALWQGHVHNNFEDSLFPKYPVLSRLKTHLKELGALYASMTGSGSVIYGLFKDKESADKAKKSIQNGSTIRGVWLLKL